MYLLKVESFTFFLYRIPSNPSVGSKGSYKISTDSIGRNSDRSSPLPSYHVEVMSLQYLELFMFVILLVLSSNPILDPSIKFKSYVLTRTSNL